MAAAVDAARPVVVAVLVEYKPPENFVGTVNFTATVSTATNAAQPATTGKLPVTVKFSAPPCAGSATYCGANGKCSVGGCKCTGSFYGLTCSQKSKAASPVESSWGGTTALLLILFAAVGVGGAIFYLSQNGYFEHEDHPDAKPETEELRHQPPPIEQAPKHI